jgi:hypothetical protein
MYFADRDNQRVRRVDAVTNIITTVAGDGIKGYGGDDGPSEDSRLYSPRDVVIDSLDNVYVADTTNRRIRVIEAGTGIIRTYAGTGQTGGTGDGGPATQGRFGSPYDMDIDENDVIYVADDNTGTRRIRVVYPSTTAGMPPVWNGDPLLSSNITSGSVELSWTAANDSDGVAGYDIFLDGQQFDATSATTIVVDGLDPATNYEFTVEAEDSDGNRSATGPTTTVTTAP